MDIPYNPYGMAHKINHVDAGQMPNCLQVIVGVGVVVVVLFGVGIGVIGVGVSEEWATW